MSAAKRMGRPPLAKKERKAAHLSVRFTEAEHHTLERAAKAAGLALSEWARSVIMSAAWGRVLAWTPSTATLTSAGGSVAPRAAPGVSSSVQAPDATATVPASPTLGERGPLRISDRALGEYLSDRRRILGYAMTPEEGAAELRTYLALAKCKREPTPELPGSFTYRSREAGVEITVTAKSEREEWVVLTAIARNYAKLEKR